MKTIRKITFMVMVSILICHCQKDNEGYVNIPDNNFLEALINNRVDTNHDGQISDAEAKDVSYLYISGDICIFCSEFCQSRLEIKGLEGIEAFTNLTTLIITCTEIEILNLPNQSKLTELVCVSNHLKSLDISKCIALKRLDVSNFKLTTLDGSKNKLTTLDISNNSALTQISLENILTLNKVCVWEMPFPPSGVEIYASGSPNLYYTLDCN